MFGGVNRNGDECSEWKCVMFVLKKQKSTSHSNNVKGFQGCLQSAVSKIVLENVNNLEDFLIVSDPVSNIAGLQSCVVAR